MRILLDTQAWLWMTTSPERFSPETSKLVKSTDNELYLSAASAWEIAIKYSIGKLKLPEPPAEYVPSRIRTTHVLPMAIEHGHVLRVSSLPPHHRDPFDRLLIAQAQVEDLPILTSDPQFNNYEVVTISP